MEDDLFEAEPAFSTQSVIDRHFRKFLVIGSNREDQYVYQHFNGLCIVGLHDSHPALHGAGIERVDFCVDGHDRIDELQQVHGKRKSRELYSLPSQQFHLPEGGVIFDFTGILCTVHTKDGQSFKIRRCLFFLSGSDAVVQLRTRFPD